MACTRLRRRSRTESRGAAFVTGTSTSLIVDEAATPAPGASPRPAESPRRSRRSAAWQTSACTAQRQRGWRSRSSASRGSAPGPSCTVRSCSACAAGLGAPERPAGAGWAVRGHLKLGWWAVPASRGVECGARIRSDAFRPRDPAAPGRERTVEAQCGCLDRLPYVGEARPVPCSSAKPRHASATQADADDGSAAPARASRARMRCSAASRCPSRRACRNAERMTVSRVSSSNSGVGVLRGVLLRRTASRA